MEKRRFDAVAGGGLLLLALLNSSPEVWAGTPNMCPTAFPQSISVAMNSQVNSQLVATDPDSDPLQFSVTVAPTHGVLVLQVSTGAFSYSPNQGYCGPDSFKFTAKDAQCTSNEATVDITVCPMTPTKTPTVTPTQTPTITPTATPTQTPRSIGEGCTTDSQCGSTFCVDGVCCKSACEGNGQVCDLPGQLGTCVSNAPAPAMSWPAVFAGACLLTIIGAFQLRRRDRGPLH